MIRVSKHEDVGFNESINIRSIPNQMAVQMTTVKAMYCKPLSAQLGVRGAVLGGCVELSCAPPGCFLC